MAPDDDALAPHGAGPSGDPPRGLVYHAGALGDFVLSLPAIYRVVQACPGHAWHLWGDRDRLALVPGFQPAPPSLVRYGHTLWGDVPAPEALTALDDFRAILAFGGAAPPGWVAPPGPQLIRVASFPPANGPWVPAHQASQIDAQGVPRLKTPWLAAWCEKVLPARAATEIVLHPGSGNPRKNAPAALWIEVLAELRQETGRPLRLVLGPAEVDRGGWQALASSVDGVTSCESLGALLQILARAALFLGNDSGASHLAATLGVPSLVLFGPSNPRQWRPLGSRVRVLEAARTHELRETGNGDSRAGRTEWDGMPAEEVVRQALQLIPPRPKAIDGADGFDDSPKRF